MATFYSFYPPAGSGLPNASVGVNGNVAPTSSTEVGGINPSGNLQPLQTDASGALIVTPAAGSVQHVIVDSSALPTGASTSANQSLEITQLTGIHSDTTSLDGKTVHVDTGNVTVVASALPTGAATAANQATEIASLASIDSKLTSPIAVTGPLTDTQLRATPVPISGTVTANNASIGATGTTVPASATLIGGHDGTNALRSISVSAAGIVDTTVTNIVNTNLGQINGSTINTGIGASGTGTQRVAISTDSFAPLQVAQGSSTVGQLGPLVQGTATTVAPTYVNNSTNPLTMTTAGALRVDSSGSTQPVSGTVTANIGTTGGLALDTTVAGLHVTQGSTTSGQTGELVLGAVTTAAPTYTTGQSSPLSLTTTGALRVSSTGNTAATGRALANAPTVTTYGTPVTSAAYTTIIASTTSATNLVELFDSSGVAIFFAVGAAAAEVNQFVIYPGGNGQVPLSIPAGSRISYKAVSTSASGATAYNVLNLYT